MTKKKRCIQTLYSVLCWSTYSIDYSLKCSWVWLYKLGIHVFGEFIPFFSADPLNHSRTFRDLPWSHSCVVLAVCLGSLSWRKVNLRPSLRTRALWSRFSSLYFTPFIFSSILTSLPVPAAWCQVSSRCDAWHSGKEFNLGFNSPDNLVSHGLRVF